MFGLLCQVMFLIILLTPIAARGEALPKILILHSYYEIYPWTDDIMKGIMSVLPSADDEISIYTEYLDAQRIPKKKSWSTFETHLNAKYRGVKFNVILASDDDILDFLIPRYENMFPDTPFVFCGINNLDTGKFKKHKAFKGVSQEIDAKGTIDLALKLLPDTENFLVISDRTSAGIKTTAKFRRDIKELGQLKQRFHLIDDFTLQELKGSLQALGPRDLVLVLRIQKIKGIDRREPIKFLKIVTDMSPVPAFRVWGTGKGEFLGGVLVSPLAQGKAAAEIASRILGGEGVQNIPQVTRSPNISVVNYAVLKKFNIDEKNIPQGTMITNRPVSILEKYHLQVQLILIFFVMLVLIIVSLIVILFQKRKSANLLVQSKDELLASEEKLNLLVNSSPIGICTVDLLGNFVMTNPAYENMLGYSKEELRKLSFFDVTHPDYRPKNRKLFKEMFSLESIGFKFEKIYIRKDGVEIHASVYGKAVLDERGKVKFGTAFIEDITERKKAEIELIQSKQLMDSVINGIAEPIFVKDENHCWIMHNDAFYQMMGHDHETLLGKSDYDFFPENEADIFWERDNIVQASDKPNVNEEKITIKGQTRILSTSKSSFNNPITGKRNIVAIIRDITDAKAMEAQLRQAQKMESVGILAGGVAHDYNNMLSIIIGYSESALEILTPDDPLYEDITEILKAGKRSTEITRQLLAFARQQTIAPRVIDLNDSIEGMLKMLRRLIGEDIDLAWRPEANLWPLKIDPTQIDQILANLCVNARDAIPGVGQLTIETKNISFDEEYCMGHKGFISGDYLMLAVSDNGSGIAPDILEKIFEPFFTTKGLHQGTGLGLSTVYGIVKQNNGFVNVYSEIEKGTTIKCYLPIHSGKGGRERLESDQKIQLGNDETILMVEDDKSILKLGERMLNGLGYTVLSASTPAEAIKIFKENMEKIKLLLTDVVMPGMNGRELSDRLRNLSPNLKTLYMSGYTANVIADRGVLEEGVFFIPKPLSKKELSFKVREVLDNGKGSGLECSVVL